MKEGNERKIKPVKPTREYLPEDPDADEFNERTTKLGNLLGTNDFFGPILRVTSKALLDEEVTSRDYENIGRGINLLIDEGISKGRITSNEDIKLVKYLSLIQPNGFSQRSNQNFHPNLRTTLQ